MLQPKEKVEKNIHISHRLMFYPKIRYFVISIFEQVKNCLQKIGKDAQLIMNSHIQLLLMLFNSYFPQICDNL